MIKPENFNLASTEDLQDQYRLSNTTIDLLHAFSVPVPEEFLRWRTDCRAELAKRNAKQPTNHPDNYDFYNRFVK